MSSISNSLSLQDRFTNTINKAVNGTNRLLKSMRAVDATAMERKTERAMQATEKATRSTNTELKKMNRNLDCAANKADPLGKVLGTLKGVVLGSGILQAAQSTMELADDMSQIRARLSLMNDGLQTTKQLQKQIMQSANRARSSFLQQADAVAKMGLMAKDAFGSNGEVIAFTELIGKQFKIAGTSTAGQSAAMVQLTQAMASGVLRGEELNSIFEQAPTIIQTISDYLKVPIGQIRSMAAEGQITADIVKNAMFTSADDINAKFAAMPMTFAQVRDVVKNTLLQAFEPAIQTIGQSATWVYNNWGAIAPVLAGVSAAVLFLAAAYGVHTAAVWLANSAMLASPVTWLALGFGLLVFAIYRWTQSVGGAEVAWAMFCDQVLALWAMLKYGFSAGVVWTANSLDKLVLASQTVSVGFQNGMGDMKTGTLKILEGMINGAIGLLNGFIETVNKIPGVSIDLIDKVTFGTTAQLENAAAKQQRNAELAAARATVEDNISERQAALDAQLAKAKTDSAARKRDIAAKKAAAADNGGAGFMAGITGAAPPNIGKVNEVGKISADVNIAEEDLKLMKDIAEMRYVQNFVTLEPRVSMSATVNRDADFDIFYDQFGQRVLEELEAAAEGVY